MEIKNNNNDGICSSNNRQYDSASYLSRLYKNSRENMVKNQIINRGIKDKNVIRAMLKVPREKFVSPEYADCVYEDRPLPIDSGQTISQPYIVALMTENLELKGDERILEIGTGSGYQAAILAEIAKEVFTVESVTSLYLKSKKILSDYKNLKISNHNGFIGWKEYSPYDRIIVTAAPDKIPDVFIEQLADPGILVIPIGRSSWNQELIKVIKKGSNIKKIKICDVAFVPLVNG